MTQVQKAEGIQIPWMQKLFVPPEESLHWSKAPYHFGKAAEFTEIHDYLLIQLHPISLSFHVTVENSEMKIGDQDTQQRISYVPLSCVST